MRTHAGSVYQSNHLNFGHARLTLGPDLTHRGKNVQNKYEYSCTGGAESEETYLNFPEKMLKLMSINIMSES